MGVSVSEGTISRWLKAEGESIEKDETMLEISTDKVDAEIPSPAAGVLLEIRVKEGETVPIDSVVGILGQAGEQVAADDARRATPAAAPQADGTAASPQSSAQGQNTAGTDVSGQPAGGSNGSEQTDEQTSDATPAGSSDDDVAARRRQKSSPLVRKIAAEHDVNLSGLQGSGVSGRVTKQDILKHLDDRDRGPVAGAASPPAAGGLRIAAYQPGEAVDVVPMPVMRRKIAEHMIYSRRTSAHVHSVFEVDFSSVAAARQAQKADFDAAGLKLTYLAFITKAIADALRAVPIVNAALDGDNIVYKKDVNVGIAVALDWGLIVPVVPRTDEKSLLGIARAIADLAARARAKQLKPEDVQGGTFTITNPGSFGTLFGMPIINQPQVAILAVGTIEKRVVVVDDMIAVRPRGYLTLGYDHRLVDGAVADQFMSRVKTALEHWT